MTKNKDSMTKSGESKKPDSRNDQSIFEALTKTDVAMSGWGGIDKEPSPPDDYCPINPDWTETDDIEYLGALVRQWRKEKGFMSFAWLKLFVWVLALDQPVGSSKRGMTMAWLIVRWACLVLDYRRLKLYLENLRGVWWR